MALTDQAFLQITRDRLTLYLKYEQDILIAGQAVTTAGNTLNRANLGQVQKVIDDCMAILVNAGDDVRTIKRVIPMDY